MDDKSTDFKPAWWLKNSHLQTLWPFLFRKRPTLSVRPERVTLPDGDFVDIAWMNERQSGPHVLVLHGLEGCIQSHYAGTLLSSLHQKGFNPVFMHFRGCSGEANRLPRSYHSGDTADAQFIADFIEQQTGESLAAAVGFSLGGNVLLKWLGELGGKSPLQAAVAVSVPYQLNDCAERLETGLSKIYQSYLIKRLKIAYRRKFSGMDSPLSVDLKKLGTFREFDDQITAPLHGFAGVDDYYKQSSAKQYLTRIQVPTLLIHAQDDPFMRTSTPPTREEVSDQIHLAISPHGGHVGFVTGSLPWKTEYWLDRRIATFIEHQLTTYKS